MIPTASQIGSASRVVLLGVIALGSSMAAAGQPAPVVRQPPDDRMARALAAERGESPEIQALIKGSDVTARDPVHQRTGLMWAIFVNDRAAFDRHLAAGADVNAKDADGETALMFAAQFGAKFDTAAMARALIAKGADVAVRTPGQNLTALMHAANMNAVGVAEAILTKLDAKELEVRNGFGQTALLMATFVGAERVVEILIDKGANIEGADRDGKTPLMYAVRGNTAGTDDTIAVLVNRGANPNARDKAGNTPLSEATKAGRPAVVDLLKQLGAK